MTTLVVEGGASRAAYASGVAWGLQEAGFVPDAVYGTSAGGAIAAWFAAGQAHLGARTWDHVEDRALWSYRRALRGSGPVLDFRRLYGDYYPTRFGMDVAALRRAPYPVFATVTDSETAETLYLDLRKARDPFVVLHATSAMPVVSESPVALDGRKLVDGGVTDPIPLKRAVEDGHRDLLLVANRPPGERPAESRLAVALVARRFPKLAEAARDHHLLHREALRFAEAPPPGVRVRIVRPAVDLGVSRFTRDAAKLRRAIAVGRDDGARAASGRA